MPRIPFRLVARPLIVLVLPLLAACQTASTVGEGATPTYASDADTNLAKGAEALESRNYVEAERYFEYVKNKYPFLEAAKTAELRLADTEFERDRFPEARDGYQNFVKLHPTHPKVDYAAFRAAMTFYKEIPGDYFFMPSSREKDQGDIRRTLSAMSDFVKQYPTSAFVPEAEKLVAETRKRLAEHELYVADFYASRGRWGAVVSRLKNVIDQYPGVGYEARAYFGIHDAYVKLKDEARAKEALRSIVQKLPGTDAAARAKKLLGEGG